MAPPPTVQPPPPPTVSNTPPPSDVPWWGALILAVLTAIVSVIGTVLFLRGGSASVPGAPPGIGQIFTDIITFIPHILILFGVLADIFTLQGCYSIPSLVGLASLPLHKLAEFLWMGVATLLNDVYRLAMTTPAPAAPATSGGAMSAWPGCDIYGFEYFHTRYAPQGLVVTSTIFWYYLIDLFMNRNILDSIAAIIAFVLFFGLETMQLKTCKDFTDSVWIKAFIALSEGFFIGGTGYAIVQSSAPNRLPSAVLPQGPNLSSLTKNADGSYSDSTGAVYIVGPDGRPIPKSFIAAATAGASSAAGAGAGALSGASATSCPR